MMDADEREYEFRREVAEALDKDMFDLTKDDLRDYASDMFTRQTLEGAWRQ